MSCNELAMRNLEVKKKQDRIDRDEQNKRNECISNNICPNCGDELNETWKRFNSFLGFFLSGIKESEQIHECFKCGYKLVKEYHTSEEWY